MKQKASSVIKSNLIAPCGMNCALCMARLHRKKDLCPGCRGEDKDKPKRCRNCIIVNCEYRAKTKSKFCTTKCPDFPCRRLTNLDKRYKAKYNMSMIENIKKIEKSGIRAFIKSEKQKWACKKCGGVVCIHTAACVVCKKPFQKNRTK